MIGNDIIDLAEAGKSPNWKRKRFLDKLFSSEEQDFIKNSGNTFQAIWTLWSMKESAYKAYARQFSKIFHDPGKVICHLKTATWGRVTIFKSVYFTSSRISGDYIYTIAFTEQSDRILSDWFRINEPTYPMQHLECYQRMLQVYTQATHNDIEGSEIRKNTLGIPGIFYKNRPQSIPITITHHGHFGGYAMLL